MLLPLGIALAPVFGGPMSQGRRNSNKSRRNINKSMLRGRHSSHRSACVKKHRHRPAAARAGAAGERGR